MLLLFQGIVAGILMALPTGPVGLLGIGKMFGGQFKSTRGFIVGSIVGDLLFAIIAVYSLHAIRGFLLREEELILIFGGVLLLSIGIKTWFSKPKEAVSLTKLQHVGNFFSAFLMTLSNPVQLISLPLLFVGLGVSFDTEIWQSGLFLIGTVLGSIVCWTILTLVVTRVKKKFKGDLTTTIYRASAIVIAFTGILILLKVLVQN